MNERGSVYTEFAIVIPALLILFFGIFYIQRGLEHSSVLIAASNESWWAGSGSTPLEGEEKMNLVRNMFEEDVEARWTGFDSTPRYFELDDGGTPVPLVEVIYEGDVLKTPFFSAFSLKSKLVGPHVARNLAVPNANNFDIVTPASCIDLPMDPCRFDCGGNLCGGTSGGACSSNPCS